MPHRWFCQRKVMKPTDLLQIVYIYILSLFLNTYTTSGLWFITIGPRNGWLIIKESLSFTMHFWNMWGPADDKCVSRNEHCRSLEGLPEGTTGMVAQWQEDHWRKWKKSVPLERDEAREENGTRTGRPLQGEIRIKRALYPEDYSSHWRHMVQFLFW